MCDSKIDLDCECCFVSKNKHLIRKLVRLTRNTGMLVGFNPDFTWSINCFYLYYSDFSTKNKDVIIRVTNPSYETLENELSICAKENDIILIKISSNEISEDDLDDLLKRHGVKTNPKRKY